MSRGCSAHDHHEKVLWRKVIGVGKDRVFNDLRGLVVDMRQDEKIFVVEDGRTLFWVVFHQMLCVLAWSCDTMTESNL
jgi:hypothetical protein